jgi:hypothetical protein
VYFHQGILVSRGDTEQVIDQYRALISETTAKQKNQRDLDQSSELLDHHGRPLNVAALDGSSNLSHGTGGARTKKVKTKKVKLLDHHGRPLDVAARRKPES